MPMRKRFARLSAVLMGLYLGLSAPAEADYIYTYTGNNFTSFTGTIFGYFTTSDYVTITMDLSGPLDANLNMSAPSGLVALTTADGKNTFYGPPSCCNETQTLLVSTDALGDITQWNISLQIAGGIYEGAGSAPSSTGSETDVGWLGGSFGITDAYSYTPGTWTLTITPEPSTGFLLSGGALGLAVIRRL